MVARPVRLLLIPASLALLFASTIPLEPYAASSFTVSMPRSWQVAEAAAGLVTARQDANHDDSAAVLFLVRAAENSSEDQLLDSVVSQFAKNLSVSLRESIPGGGHRMVADGMAGTNRMRVGVIALVTNGAALVSLLIAKPADFDRLGGIELVTTILGSLRTKGTPAPAAPTPAPTAPAPAPGAKLDVPPPARPLTAADLAGEWNNDDSVITNYVNYRGDYSGFQSIATREKWIFDGKGGVSSAFDATTAGRGGARQMSEKKSGMVAFSQASVMTLGWNGASPQSYVIRGWRELPGITVLLLNGPWYGSVPADVLADRGKGTNLNSYWVRKAKP